MDRCTAEKLIQIMKKLDEILEELGVASHGIEIREERQMIRGVIADLIHDSHLKITMPVVEQFPDLHPDKN